jgi:flagellar protein FlaG
MAIQTVGNGVSPAALNLPGTAAPSQGADAAPPRVQAPRVNTPSPQQSAASSLEQVQQAMKQVADMVQAKASNLQFSIDHDTGMTVVKVVDTQTQEVIRQIPAQEMIDIARAVEQAQGLLIQQKA